MHPIQKFIIKSLMNLILGIQAFLFKNRRLNFIGYGLNRQFARIMIRNKGVRQANPLDELGRNWQKGFPAKKHVPITHMDENTVYGEIHTHCPLRGTGGVNACYKMMSYDREIVGQAGGEFIVLESQATLGVTVCKIAMRFKGQPTDGLVPAHKKID